MTTNYIIDEEEFDFFLNNFTYFKKNYKNEII